MISIRPVVVDGRTYMLRVYQRLDDDFGMPGWSGYAACDSAPDEGFHDELHAADAEAALDEYEKALRATLAGRSIKQRSAELATELRVVGEDAQAWHDEAERWRMRADELQGLLWQIVEAHDFSIGSQITLEDAIREARLWFDRHPTKDEDE